MAISCTQRLEVVGSGNEIRLAVDLDQRSNPAAVHIAVDEALAGLPARPSLGSGDPPFPQETLGLLEVSGGILERPFAVHDAGAGFLPELLDVVH